MFVKGLYSIEEYVGKLWENLPPASMRCSLVYDNLATGFLIINIGPIVFGLWSWLYPVRKNYFYAPFLVGFWIVLEPINGMHRTSYWVDRTKSHTPGIVTAPIFLVVAVVLLRRQLNEKTKE